MERFRVLCIAATVTIALWAVVSGSASNAPPWRELSRRQGAGENLPPIGEMDIPEHGGRVTEVASVSGWALDYEEPVVTVRVYVDDQEVGQAEYPAGERPDIQADFPDVAHSLKSGFRYLLNTAWFTDGEHRVAVTVEDSGGEPLTIGENTVYFENVAPSVARPWPDTTDGVYVFKDQLPASMTYAQYQFAATHYAGCQKMVRSAADLLRVFNPDFLILHRRPGTGLGYRIPDELGQPTGDWVKVIEGNNWTWEWPQDPRDEWFYAYGGADRVYQNQWGWYLCDLDNLWWRGYWLGEVERQLRANDNDGIVADTAVVPNYLGAATFTPNLPANDPAFESEWSSKIDRWLAYARGYLGYAYKLIPNVGSWIVSRDLTTYLDADGVLIDGFAERAERDPFDIAEWQRQMDRILDVAGRGTIVIAQSTVGDTNNLSHRMFLLASYLLTKGPATFINMDMGLDPEWFPEYEVDIGPYTDPVPAQVSQLYNAGSEVYVRQYSEGIVLVNPSAVSKSFSVGPGYSRVVPHGGGLVPEDAQVADWHLSYEPVTNITMPPYSGEVLTTSGLSPGFLLISPETGLASSGPEGGPFSPASKQYTLSNTGGQSLDWTTAVFNRAEWVTASPASGTLGSGEAAAVTVSINSNADTLPAGTHSDTLVFINATSGAGNTSVPVSVTVAAGLLEVSPTSGLVSSGPQGGPFTPGAATYTLTNPGSGPVDWTATHAPEATWVTVSPASGTLNSGAQAAVTVSINANADSLPKGVYNDTIQFTNLTNGAGNTTRSVELTVQAGRLVVTPATGLVSSGTAGGPFDPASQEYALSNPGDAPINWTAAVSQGAQWITVSPASGTLAPGEQASVTVSINANADLLPEGTYSDSVAFANTTNGDGNTTRAVQLTVLMGTLAVTPEEGFVSSGAVGGPFTPTSKQYLVTNPGSAPIDFAVGKESGANWIDVSPAAGALAPGQSLAVTVSINANADALPAGAHTENVIFTNTTNGVGNTSRSVNLSVVGKALSSVDVTTDTLTCLCGDPRQIYATAYFTDGTDEDITSMGSWSSSNPSVASVSADGLVSPVNNGDAVVTCAYVCDGAAQCGTCSVTVSYTNLYYVYISPSSYTFRSAAPEQYKCFARTSNFQTTDVTYQCSWMSSNTGVVTVDKFGLAAPIGNGDALIVATYVFNGMPKTALTRVKVRLW